MTLKLKVGFRPRSREHDGFVRRTTARVPRRLEGMHRRWRGGAERAVEGQVITVAPSHDPRVQALCDAYPKLRVLISRFTDTFHDSLSPVDPHGWR